MVTKITDIGGEVPTNGGQSAIEAGIPYIATVRVKGTSSMLFHRYNPESVEAKSKAAKGSAAKKTDDIESFVWRDDDGNICLPGEYLRGAIINAAKFRQDPRSPRKSAMDLYKAGISTLTELASLGIKKWDYEDSRGVSLNRNKVTRTRPAVKAGWEAEIQLMINLPEYITPADLNDVIGSAGRLVGLADYRPTYGRFQVVGFEVSN